MMTFVGVMRIIVLLAAVVGVAATFAIFAAMINAARGGD